MLCTSPSKSKMVIILYDNSVGKRLEYIYVGMKGEKRERKVTWKMVQEFVVPDLNTGAVVWIYLTNLQASG